MLNRRRVLVRLVEALHHLGGEALLEMLPTLHLRPAYLVNRATTRRAMLSAEVVGCLEITSQPQLRSDLQLVSHLIIRMVRRSLIYSNHDSSHWQCT